MQLLEALDWKLMHESDLLTIQVLSEHDNVLRFYILFYFEPEFFAFLFLQRTISEMVIDASNDINLLPYPKVTS